MSTERWSYYAALNAIASNSFIGTFATPVVLGVMLRAAGVSSVVYTTHAIALASVMACTGVAARHAAKALTDRAMRQQLPTIYLLLAATGLLTGLVALLPLPIGSGDETDSNYPFLLAAVIVIMAANIATGYARVRMYAAIAVPMAIPGVIGAVLWGGSIGFVVALAFVVVGVLTAINARTAGTAFRTTSELMVRNKELLAELSHSNEHLDHRAHTDPLTGIFNRAGFGRFIDERRTLSGVSAIFFLDLDGFKSINDDHGHEAGDTVLRVTAERLTSAVRDGDVVARLGGDEFVVVAHVASSDDVAAMAIDLERVVSEPIRIAEVSVAVSASIGHSVAERSDELPAAVGAADAAMYRSKRRARVT